MLFSRTLSVHEGTTRPVLVFLHGLLGSGEDWRTCARSLSDFRSIALDLPGHGRSVAVDCDSLNQAATQVADTLSARLPPGSRWCWWAIRSADGLPCMVWRRVCLDPYRFSNW
ncbi:alpha/beta fold hydrolase [Photobacterium sp. GJ3]|uniref:alpha/beta fold hydrolase n=1 Tax=Photobacterium sp. GJ3 TaxID=2829502 RepID=UPI0035304E5D